MKLQENNQTIDAIDDVSAVLDFIAQTACWPTDGQIEMKGRAVTGLVVILEACRESLNKAVDSMSEPIEQRSRAK